MLQNTLYDSAIVGIGRSGTTLVYNLLDSFYGQQRKKYPKLNYNPVGTGMANSKSYLEYEHWDKNRIKFEPTKKIIICKRDLRDVFASGFRGVAIKNTRMYNDKNFLLSEIKNYPSNFKKYKECYGITETHLINEGNNMIKKGWDQWIEHVDYIFHYEKYMENPHKIIKELADLINFKGDLNEAYQYTLNWKQRNPNHISNKGLSNSWDDIFSKAQEDVILNNFKDWLYQQNYITNEHYKNLCSSK